MERKEKAKEMKYEILMGQLILIVIVGILLSIAAGFFLGKEVGYSKGVNAVTIDKPEYCYVDKTGEHVQVKCNELEGITLEDMCGMLSEELKDKVKIVIIT